MTSLLSQLKRNVHFKCVQYKESNAVTNNFYDFSAFPTKTQ
jgi:hypothetical protein